MGNTSSWSSSIPYLTTYIRTRSGAVFSISYSDLVDHIILLRHVIDHPQLIENGKSLEWFIYDYCYRMSNNKLMSKSQQIKLPWQTDWIWHVHRLHPVAYYNDCIKLVPGGYFIDKKVQRLRRHDYPQYDWDSSKQPIQNKTTFIPSINLVQAVLQQREFLQKFQKHAFYTQNLSKMNSISFERMVENYMSFIKLAQQNTIIVPTFDIDLMWHTHMRYPLNYFHFSIALYGSILDHNDSLDPQILKNAYQDTAARWKIAYQSEYGENVDQNYRCDSHSFSQCATIYKENKKRNPIKTIPVDSVEVGGVV